MFQTSFGIQLHATGTSIGKELGRKNSHLLCPMITRKVRQPPSSPLVALTALCSRAAGPNRPTRTARTS